MALNATRLADAINPVLKQGIMDAIEAVFDIVPGDGEEILEKFCQAFADGASPAMASTIIAEITANAVVNPGTLAITPSNIVAPNGGGACSGTGTVTTGTGTIT